MSGEAVKKTDNHKTYNPGEIELKWQRLWKAVKAFKVDKTPKKPKFYCLEMYPYPSGKLHMGHLRNYSIGDCIARFKRLQGFNVLYPMGYDAFGLPAENAALTKKVHPEDWTLNNIESIKKQQERLGFSYDWDRQLQSCDVDYYKWNQYFFLKMLKAGLAYRKKSFVNWCPHCKTVLANEQVIAGKCWRCHSVVEHKELEQWFFNTKRYAQELLDDLKSLDWPERVKVMQKNWIGKSVGTKIKFKVLETNDVLEVFTTRPDTLFGVTFLVVAAEHELARNWVRGSKLEKPYQEFLNKVLSQEFQERTSAEVEKLGFNLEKHAVHPLTNEKIPVYAANFVLAEYGSGVVMGVPAHDQRDFEFAKNHNLPIRVVVQPHDHELRPDKMLRAFEGFGVLVNSQQFTGLDSETAIEEITKKLESLNIGGKAIEYKLKDWLISRQRYWGTPIPVVYCEKCGVVPVPFEQLPVKLPKNVDFSKPGNPLANNPDFVNTICPKCGGKATRETDTMDTFVDSSWYFLRYCSPRENNKPFDIEKLRYWMPVDIYIGGIEHATMHLIYARFFVKALRDLGLLDKGFSEPFKKLVSQGMVTAPARYCPKCNTFLPPEQVENNHCKVCGSEIVWRSAKMSKSLGNTVSPEEVINKYGADAARLAILATSSVEKDLEWNDENVKYWFNFLNSFYSTIVNTLKSGRSAQWRLEKNIYDEFLKQLLYNTILEVTNSLELLKIREALLKLSKFTKFFIDYCKQKSKPRKQEFLDALKKLSILLNPFAPHISEEVWSMTLSNATTISTTTTPTKTIGKLGMLSFASLQEWPNYKEKQEKPDLTSWNHALKLLEDINKISKLAMRRAVKPSKALIIIASDYKRKAILKALKVQKKQTQQEIKGSKPLKTKQKQIKQRQVLQTHLVKAFKDKGLNPELAMKVSNRLLKNVELLSMLKTSDYLTQEAEFKLTTRIKQFVEEKTNLKIQVLLEEQAITKDVLKSKAEQSMPAMPGIVLI